MNHQQWYTEQDTEKQTPLLLADILHLVKKGELQRNSILIDAAGNHVSVESILIMDHTGFTESESNQSDTQPAEPPKPPPPPSGIAVSVKRPWNPLAIVWLGLLFTPAWTGIMTAINTGRLKSDQPLWRPLAIGIGSTVLGIMLSCAGIDHILLDILFMTVPLIAIWITDLAQQEEAYSEESPKSQDHWILPVLAGSPIALLTIVGWWFTLFAPLEPSEVVKRFVDADKTEERQKYVTLNLSPLLKDINKLDLLSPNGTKLWIYKSDNIELFGEYPSEDNENQQLVEFRASIVPDSAYPNFPQKVHGFFLMQWTDKQWKIDDMRLIEINGEEQTPPVSFVLSLQYAIEEERKQADNQSSEVVTKPLINSSKPSIKSSIGSELNKHKDTLVKGKGIWFLLRGLFVGGGLKKIGGGILFVIAAGAAALSRGFGGGSGESK